jgi:carbon monoxide dehydrogenase subunit G
MGAGPEISASAQVPAPPAAVFDFLGDLENHWHLADRFIEVVRLERAPGGSATGGRVRMHGPLGVCRAATTRVLAAEPPRLMVGAAEIGRRTRAFVRWKLSEEDGRTRVTLEATVDQAGALDRLLLILGGRAWLERRFDAVLERLAQEFAGSFRQTTRASM